MDGLEYMNGVLAHNWAGWDHQVAFKPENQWDGHVTLKMSDIGARATDCSKGM